MAKQVFDVTNGKGMSQGQSTEHLRNYSVIDPNAKKFGYYDPTRVNLNFEVGKGGVIMPVRKQYSIVQRFKENLRNRGVTDPNEVKRKKGLEPNRNTVANIILGGSRDQMHKLAFGDQVVNHEKGADNRHIQRHEDIEKWAKDMYDFVVKKFGEENIVAFIVHLDEKNPHIHCTLVPVNSKNKISYKDIFGDPKSKDPEKNSSRILKRLQDELYREVNQKWELERGDPIEMTHAKHRTSEEYWLWLRQRCNEMEKEKASQQEMLDFLKREAHRAEIKSKGLSTMILNLQRRQRDLMQELQELQDRIRRGEVTAQEIEKEKEKLEKELKTVEEKMTNKQSMLEDVEQQIKDLETQLYNMGGHYAELEKKSDMLKRTIVNNLEPEAEPAILRDMQSIGFESFQKVSTSFSAGLKELLSQMDERTQTLIGDFFRDSGMEHLTEHAAEISAVASALFLGYIDQATNYAVSHGGGGGPGGGWGRDPNDDDDAWKRKCFGMAALMMRPAQSLRQSQWSAKRKF